MSAGPSQQTAEVEERLRFDEQSLKRYLAQHISGFTGDLEVRKFGWGASNPTFFVTTSAGQKYVLRKKPPGKLIKGAHAVEREWWVMNALAKEGFDVPKMHVLCEDAGVIGTPFYVMGFVKGRIADNGLKNLSLEQRRPAMFAIVQSLAKLHNYSPEKLGLLKEGNAFGKVGGFYERQIKTMTRTSEGQVAGSGGKVGALESMPALMAQFAAHMPADRSTVIHGDYKPDNVILSEDDKPRVLTIVDWELSTIGHPLSDMANLCLAYNLGPLGSLLNYGPYAEGSPSEAEVHEAYCKATGTPYPIPDWSFFVAFACLRLAVIVQGVAMRAATGQGSQKGGEQQAQGMAQMANELCSTGLRMMNESYGPLAKM